MAKSALLKSSLAKKYWMALTGLFLCLFLLGHLAGNLQLIFSDADHFNQYALFMTSNPAVKALSYLTYFSILFHAVDGIMLAYQNAKARPVRYAKEKPETNTKWASRNMAVLGTLILIFIVTHMVNFWARMHFDKNMPLQKLAIEREMMPGMPKITQEFYITTGVGQDRYLPVQTVDGKNVVLEGTTFYTLTPKKIKIAEGYKDLYKITIDFFKDAKYGLLFTILYVVSMIVLAFHLNHGFASAFQSMGWNHPKYNGMIKSFGTFFSIVVPLLFAAIPLYIHFLLKA
ncbi:Succinate dehydrogenase (Or fumarate reductase) cytochrome b subunit, b558 family [Flavobacterium longum]|uniref:succinate dehydrogenase cytochrome b subunit n=1 Tax=Flavobacterium longum TaxID=1299340 RepID=UPI0039E7F573